MDALEGLLYGLQIAFTPENILAALIGALLGTIIGVLPGLGPLAGAAIVLPATFTLDPVTGLIVLGGVFYGAMYGGSTTSVLLRIPGETSSVVAALDGYQLARKGRAGAVLTIMAVGSFLAATFAIICAQFLAPVVSKVALAFGPSEYFALALGGLILLAGITGGSFAKGLVSIAFGMALATVGIDAVSATSRFTFGTTFLAEGFNVVPIAMGLFGVAEVIRTLQDKNAATPISVRLREIFPTRSEWRQSLAPWARGGVIGFVLGLLPGPTAALSTFASYRVEKGLSPRRKEFGTGVIAGVAGPEAANNAAATANFIPLLALGIPFAPVMAILLSAMQVHGITPGPLLSVQHPEIFWGVIASFYLGNILLLFLNVPLIPLWVRLLRTPKWVLAPIILAACGIGTYLTRNSLFDLVVLCFAGVLGFFMPRFGYSPVLLLLGLVLGPLVEKNLRENLFLNQGDVGTFITNPISAAIWIVVLVSVTAPFWSRPIRAALERRRLASAAEPATTNAKDAR
jgi:putative tricarboxylic transport membrane protein